MDKVKAIICEENPDTLIAKIGDRNFTLCDDSVDLIMRGPHYPTEVRIIDCEDGMTIKVNTDYGEKETMKAANALLKLLNQDYHVTET